MARVLLLTATGEPAAAALPSLSLLPHQVRLIQAPAVAVLPSDFPAADALLVDARKDLVRATAMIRQVAGAGPPVLAIVSEGGWAAVSAAWGVDDVILDSAGPGEVEARLRLAIAKGARGGSGTPGDGLTGLGQVRSGELVIDEPTYTARVGGGPLDLTFKEFELLKFLAQHPRRVFSRTQLLQEVWGYDYFGGTRTVDVHVRRLRAKLGPENEDMIGTVRNVGYKFVPRSAGSDAEPEAEESDE